MGILHKGIIMEWGHRDIYHPFYCTLVFWDFYKLVISESQQKNTRVTLKKKSIRWIGLALCHYCAHTQWCNDFCFLRKTIFPYYSGTVPWSYNQHKEVQNSCAHTLKRKCFLLSYCCNWQIRWEASLYFFNHLFSSNLFASTTLEVSWDDWKPSCIKRLFWISFKIFLFDEL